MPALRRVHLLFAFLATLAAMPARADGADIVLLGDKARIALFKLCTSPCDMGGARVETVGANPAASDIANAAVSARHAIIVLDATVGVTALTREHIQAARQAGVPSMSIYFARVSALGGKGDANEALELQELEMRELLGLYEIRGDAVMVFHETEPKPLLTRHTNGLGIGAALYKASLLPPRPRANARTFTASSITATVSLLTAQEVPQTQALTEKSSVTLWVNGQLLKGVTVSKGKLAPGEHGPLELALPDKLTVAPGARFFLEQKGKLYALGVVTGAVSP
jgi:translation elongation factor EF-Tu-like GTPase